MIWYCIPSARPWAQSTCAEWERRGYGLALWRDPEPGGLPPDVYCDVRRGTILIVGKYQGYAAAVNALIEIALRNDRSCQWVVTGGDDVMPDQNCTPEQIAAECSAHFGLLRSSLPESGPPWKPEAYNHPTFGVMQPTGDRWGDDPMARAQWPGAPAYIDRVAGSPWIGREFAETINGGRGPIWHEYKHMFEDEELQEVAKKLGVFQQRRDLTHYHKHWMRDNNGDSSQMPEFLREVSSQAHWEESQNLFRMRKAGGFPGHQIKERQV